MFHKIREVKPLPDNRLIVHFAEGITKTYNMSMLCTRIPEFTELINNPKLFKNVQVDTGGYGIVWNEQYDLSAEELWENGI